MDTFTVIVFSGILFTFLVFVGIGAFSRVRTRDITEKDEWKRWDALARIEEREVPEMVDGQNEIRRRQGRRERSEHEVRSRVGAEQAERLDRADAEVRSASRG
jgi:hypothetical protein